MKRIFSILCVLLLGGASLVAQEYHFGGVVMHQAGISPGQMAQLSQTQPYGTARVMAMGGAFASLGGDISAMVINPAGLGMFRSNEFAFTPMVTVSESQNSQASFGDGNSKTRFTPTNFGFVFNPYEGIGNVVSISVGLGYNRIADLNYRTSMQWDSPYGGQTNAPSILNVMAGQLTVGNLYPDQTGFLGYYGANYPDLWGAMLAYNNYLLNPYEDNQGPYWETDHVGYNARVGHFYEQESRGSIGEWDISVGLNVNNFLYIGATLGIQSVSQRVDTYYGEDYRYEGSAVNGAGDALIEQADYMHYYQESRTSGVGFNGKFGLILRPIQALRIGVALHTPTAYILNHSYYASMSSMCYNNDEQRYYAENLNSDGSWIDEGPDSWEFRSPTRLMAGISYTFGARAVISVDYERDWYNGLCSREPGWWVPNRDTYSRGAFKSSLQATNTVRAGVEFKPIAPLSLRVGGGYTSSMVRSEGMQECYPLAEQVTFYTAGVGYAFSRSVALDVAYQYHRTENSSYRLFYGALVKPDGTREIFDAAELVSSDYLRHHIAMTLTFKF